MNRLGGSLSWFVFMQSLALLSQSLGPATTSAEPILSTVFTRIADTSTEIPGGTGTFTAFNGPVLDNGVVAFEGEGSDGQKGIYTGVTADAIQLVADRSTEIPSGIGDFEQLNHPQISEGTIVFSGGLTAQQGVYSSASGALTVIADSTTPIPGGSGTFDPANGASVSGDTVSFWGAEQMAPFQAGVFTSTDGNLETIVDRNTAVPGGAGNFRSFTADTHISDGVVAFRGYDSGVGWNLYTSDGSTVELVAGPNDPIPGGLGNFTSESLGNSFSDGVLAFIGQGDNNQRGIYTKTGGTIELIADRNTTVPEGVGAFTDTIGASTSGGNIIFIGVAVNQRGIYGNFGGGLEKIIDLSDSLDGKTLTGLGLGPDQALDGQQFVFGASFTDGSRGIYRADIAFVPEPTSALISMIALAGVLIRRQALSQLS